MKISVKSDEYEIIYEFIENLSGTITVSPYEE